MVSLPRWAVVGLGVLMVSLALDSMLKKSLTFDELSYIPAGYTYWKSGDLRLNREHPPLAKYLAGLPVVLFGPDVPVDLPPWRGGDQWAYGKAWFAYPGVPVERTVLLARLPSLALGLLLLLGVCLFARDLYGWGAGVLAAALCALSPNILAHMRLATTDIAAACLGLWAIYLFWRFTRRASWGRAVCAGLLLGLALLAKYNAILLVALFGFWLCVIPWMRDGLVLPEKCRWRAVDRPIARVLCAAVAGLLVLAVAAVVVSLGYLRPLGVATWIENAQTVYTNTPATFQAYLMGEFQTHSFWQYFFVAFAVKTPLVVLLLLALRAVTHFFDRRESGAVRVILLGAVVGFFALTTWKALGIGVRYLLPVYPLLFVFVGGMWGSRVFRSRAAKAALVAAGAWLAITSVRIHPDYLAYFSEIAGGPDHGIAWLDDSNIDWGQDLIQLREYLRDKRPERAFVTTMTWYDPALYGVDATWITVWRAIELLGSPSPPRGLYALSVHVLNRVRQGGYRGLDPLHDLVPTAVIGHTFYVYER